METLPSWLITVVISTALIVGSVSVGTSNVVWFRKQIFGTGGSILTFSGVLLIGLSIWGNIQLEGNGWKLNLKRIASEIKENPEQAMSILGNAAKANPDLAVILKAQQVSSNPFGEPINSFQDIQDEELIAYTNRDEYTLQHGGGIANPHLQSKEL